MTESLTTSASVGPTVVTAKVRRRLPDIVAITVLMGVFPVVHDLWSWISAPYWLDETWVALSTRVALSDLPVATSSTPIGFSFLLRAIPDQDALRIVPMVFHLAGVVLAYCWGRLFRPGVEGVVVGIASGAAVLLFPLQQVRHDLKQFSADAAVTLLFLVLATWIDRGWTRGRLAVLVAAVPVASLVSHLTAIAAAATFGALLIYAWARRDWPALREALVASAAGGGLFLVNYLIFVRPNRSEALDDFWVDYFPSLGELPGHVASAVVAVPGIGTAGAVALALLLAVTARLFLAVRRPRAVLACGLLLVLAMMFGLAGLYPFLDLRTSHYLYVAVVAFAGIASGLASLWAVAALRVRVSASWRPALSLMLVIVAVGGYAVIEREWYRLPGISAISHEDVRGQVAYVLANRTRDDVVVVGATARFGAALYWDDKQIRIVPAEGTVAWSPVIDDPGVVVVQGRTSVEISEALGIATAMAQANGSGARVWVIRSHFDPVEWDRALAPYEVLERTTDGREPVLLVQPRS